MKGNAATGSIYGLGVLGAFVYFVQHSVGVWGVVLAILKAVFWPALVMYKVLELLKM